MEVIKLLSYPRENQWIDYQIEKLCQQLVEEPYCPITYQNYIALGSKLNKEVIIDPNFIYVILNCKNKIELEPQNISDNLKVKIIHNQNNWDRLNKFSIGETLIKNKNDRNYWKQFIMDNFVPISNDNFLCLVANEQFIPRFISLPLHHDNALTYILALHFHNSLYLHHIDYINEEDRLKLLEWKSNFWFQDEIFLIDTKFKIPFQKWNYYQSKLQNIATKIKITPDQLFWDHYYYSYCPEIYQQIINDISHEQLLIQLWNDEYIDSSIKLLLIKSLNIPLEDIFNYQLDITTQCIKYSDFEIIDNKISKKWLKHITREFLVYGIIPEILIELSRLSIAMELTNKNLTLEEIIKIPVNKIKNYHHVLDAVDLPQHIKNICRKYVNDTNTAQLILPKHNPLFRLVSFPTLWIPDDDWYIPLIDELKTQNLKKEILDRFPWTLPYDNVISSITYKQDLQEIKKYKSQIIEILKKNCDFWKVIISFGNRELINDLLSNSLASPFDEDLEDFIERLLKLKFSTEVI